jgi:hypothetical protein
MNGPGYVVPIVVVIVLIVTGIVGYVLDRSA